jgi:hypothetical protein
VFGFRPAYIVCATLFRIFFFSLFFFFSSRFDKGNVLRSSKMEFSPPDDDLAFLDALAAIEKNIVPKPSSAPTPKAAEGMTTARHQITPRPNFFEPRAKRPLQVEAQGSSAGAQEDVDAGASRVDAHWVWPESTDFPRRSYQ